MGFLGVLLGFAWKIIGKSSWELENATDFWLNAKSHLEFLVQIFLIVYLAMCRTMEEKQMRLGPKKATFLLWNCAWFVLTAG